MKCPVDNETLIMTERNGVEIDYCPTCRGVWLDRGELDKIISRSAPTTPTRAPEHQDRYHGDKYGGDRRPYHKKKKESFLSELFDF